MQIEQVCFSRSVKSFEKGFCDLWGVSPYKDKEQPALFVGVYRQEDVDNINNHSGFKAVWHTGRARDCITNLNPNGVVIRISPMHIMDRLTNKTKASRYYIEKFNTKYCTFPIRDFSACTTTPLGENIYCYLGNERGKKLMGGDLVMEIEKRTDFNIIVGLRGKDYQWVIDNWYNECFVGLKPSMTGGCTTAIELAHMGRYTISNTYGLYYKPYSDIDDILRIIDEESKKIGTIQKPLIDGYFDTGEEWKEVGFWL
jgi:hypothetical protein